MDDELVQMVGADLKYLSEEWSQDIDDHSLRRTSPILRNLLVEGHLGRVASYLGEKIFVDAPAISRDEEVLSESSLQFYQCGGAKYQGTIVSFVRKSNRTYSAEEMKNRYERDKALIGTTYRVSLGKYMNQASFKVGDAVIRRDEVVKYVTNKLGGAHFDPFRSKQGSKKALNAKYELMDKIREGLVVADKNAVYYEILSIGQAVVGSRDVQRIQSIINAT